MSDKHGANMFVQAEIPSPWKRVALALRGRDTVKETRAVVNSRAFTKRYTASQRKSKAARRARRANRA